MDDEHEQDPSPDPEADARIRALLSELGTAPDATAMPPEVAARLDVTLARLVAEREQAAQDEDADETTTESAVVVPLQRRWRTRAAAAAAAVIVVGGGGFAVAQLTSAGGGAQSDSASAGSASKSESLDDSTASPGSSPVPQPNSLSSLDAPVATLGAATFDRDVARLLGSDAARVPALSAGEEGARGRSPAEASDGTLPATSCAGPRVTDGAVPLAVTYDGRRAVLLVHPERGGRRLVEAWSCSGARRLDSAEVPVSPRASDQSSPGDPGLGSPSPSP